MFTWFQTGCRRQCLPFRGWIPRFDGAILSLECEEAVWDRFVTGAPRTCTRPEQQYSDCELRSRGATCLRLGATLLEESQMTLTVVDINPRLFTVAGGPHGEWAVTSQRTIVGANWPATERVSIMPGPLNGREAESVWELSGVTTNDRYTTRPEKQQLIAKQAPVGRPEATRAALLLLRKNVEWWALSQDERRHILEEESHHIAIGFEYLPAVSRRLMHCRDLAQNAPFDFLGFLDFTPKNEAAFDDLLGRLRATHEWHFMDREIDIRLSRN